MKNPTLAVIGFPGNNCEIETVRAAERNGFDAVWVRWNQPELIGSFDAYVLPGGFSFEDRGRAGAIAAREPIFEALRSEAKAGKVILGICNGAQMIVESGLIPVGNNPLPYALADNIRRDEAGHVVGTGYYTAWVNLKVDRADTAFTNQVKSLVRVPIAHGEGRFTSQDSVAREVLAEHEQVAFRYTDAAGKVDPHYPVTPNGADQAVAMIVNQEGTIGALMPHPERFFAEFSGDQIWQSMRHWVEHNASPEVVTIGDLSAQPLPEIKVFERRPNTIYLEKTLIITDNEGFSVESAAQTVAGKSDLALKKSIIYAITAPDLTVKELTDTGLIHNANKENLLDYAPKPHQFLVEPLVNDAADHLADQLTELLEKNIQVRILKGWDFVVDNVSATEKILQNGLLANPNAHKIFSTSSDF